MSYIEDACKSKTRVPAGPKDIGIKIKLEYKSLIIDSIELSDLSFRGGTTYRSL